MTKNVRIENADTSSYKVTVEICDDNEVTGPTQLSNFSIWKGRYLVIRETL